MSKEQTTDLIKFLKPFSKEIQKISLWLREFVWDLYPDCNELIYDNYAALAFGWSTSDRAGDVFCSIALYSNKCAHFGFLRGTEIADPEKMLSGNGKLYRYIRVTDTKDFPKAYMKKLLKDAHKNSLARLKAAKENPKGATITKMIAPVKKRPK